MPLLTLKLPPGIRRSGTRYESRGRWYDGNLVRFLEGAKLPIGGWEELDDSDLAALTFHAVARLSLTANADNNETVTLDTKAYKFQTELSNVNGNVLIGVTESDSFANLAAAILLGAGSGTKYAAAMTLHPTVTAKAGPGGAATGVLTLADNAANTETVTIDAKVYTFEDELSDVDGNVHVGADADESIDNLIAAIMLGAGSGTAYAASMTEHPTVTAAVGAGDTMGVTSKTNGGNSLASTETMGNGSWGAATLTGGTATMVAEAKSDGLEGVGIASTETLDDGSWDVAALIGNVPRAIIGWRDNTSNAPQLAIGTNSRIYQFAQGTLTDLTPRTLTTGAVETEASVGGYGVGAYGIGSYGVGDSSQAVMTEAASWQLDTFGDYLVAVLTADGTLWLWDGDTDTLTAVTNAPSNNDGVVVTPERFVVALGADGNPRKLKWADQESLTTWTAASGNQAGDWILPGAGTILCGRRGRNETLIFTDRDLFAMRYIGGTLIYAVPQLGSSCGLISRHAVAMVDGKAVWMGHRGFFLYDGFVRSLPSEVSDYVFKDFNRMQQAKCWTTALGNFGEVLFFYCSSGSQEPDRCAAWNFRENHWALHKLDRTVGMDRGSFEYPIFVNTTRVYEHERGTTHSGAGTPFLESGPIELGNGAEVMMARQLIPDESTLAGQVLGSVNATIYSATYPTATEVTNGPYTLANPTPVRLTGRQVRVKLEEVAAGDWRVGDLRLEAEPVGMR